MEQRKKFSIIIPSYNTEKFIRQCIDSVLFQNYDNYEILIVDDGSTDNTYKIEQEYFNKYPEKIQLQRTKHLGVSNARNIAIQQSTGDYILFLDSDDYFRGDIFNYLNRICNKKEIDCFVCTFESFSDDCDIKPLKCEDLNSKSINNLPAEKVLNYFYGKRLIQTMWRFVIKTSIIKKNKLYLTPGIVHEDEEWVVKTLTFCNTFHLIPFKHYVYRRRKGSIMANYNYFNFKCMFKVVMNLLDFYKTCDKEYKRLFVMRTVYKLSEICYYDIKNLANPDN